MAVVKVKPTSPGRRAVVKVVHKHLHKGAPEASLLEPQKQNSGRNNNDHIKKAYVSLKEGHDLNFSGEGA